MRHDDRPNRLDTPFGTFDIDPDSVVQFPQGLPGYEDCRQFVLLSAPSLMPLQCLHAVSEQGPTFLVIDPGLVAPDYERHAAPADLQRLGCTDPESLLWLSIVTVAEDGIRANLWAPVVISPERMRGVQLVPANSSYSGQCALPLAG